MFKVIRTNSNTNYIEIKYQMKSNNNTKENEIKDKDGECLLEVLMYP